MELLQIFILSLVQGITEFLPISSSAHLVLVPVVAGWEDQGIVMDVAVHVGTLFAVMVYFYREVHSMFCGGIHLLTGHVTPSVYLLLYIILASIPVIIIGFLLHLALPGGIRSPELIAWMSIVFGLLLYVADRFGGITKKVEDMTWAPAVMIGLAQILALIPGTSRSGVTMTAARALGFGRVEAARFALLLGIPAIAGAGVVEGAGLIKSGDLQFGIDAAIACALSFFSALIAIYLMLRWLKSASFLPFVIYRVGLGIGILILL